MPDVAHALALVLEAHSLPIAVLALVLVRWSQHVEPRPVVFQLVNARIVGERRKLTPLIEQAPNLAFAVADVQ